MEHKKKNHLIKGSTIIIVVMYLSWCLYIGLSVWMRIVYNATLDSTITLATAALFIVETAALAKLKMTKEGTKVDINGDCNPFLSKLGLNMKSAFDSLTEENNKKIEEQEKQTELPVHKVNTNPYHTTLEYTGLNKTETCQMKETAHAKN